MRAAHILVVSTLAALVVFLSLPAGPAKAATYVVDTTDDDPGVAKTACTGDPDDCSLRGAMTNAAAVSSPGDVITFDATIFPPGGATTIPLSTILPLMSGGDDTLDGTGAEVIIDAAGEAPSFTCLSVPSSGNTIKGLTFTDCTNGIALGSAASDGNTIGPDNVFYDNIRGIFIGNTDATGNSIVGNKVGTTADGTAIAPDGGNVDGVEIIGANNSVGGVDPADRNVISGNGDGVTITNVSATGNQIYGNYIGTDLTGAVDLGNGSGVNITNGSNNAIGGTAAGAANVISGNGQRGISISSDSNLIQGNLIGTDASGTAALPNDFGGVSINGSDNTVGGTVAGAGNLISGNNTDGVVLRPLAAGNAVEGNFIGTDVNGTADLGNASIGVRVAGDGNTIGGTSATARNVISGNLHGVFLQAPNNSVQGNYIGTDLTGTVAIGNGDHGVNINDGSNNLVGGTASGAGNVISGNGSRGVFITGSLATGNTVQGNLVGTDVTGILDLGNASIGVSLIGEASNNSIGGTAVGAGNTIAFNGFAGVRTEGASVENPIRGNSIHSNVGPAIDNFAGGNTELAPPVITAAGSASGTACANCVVDVYSDDADEGRVYHGSTTADGLGDWAFTGAVTGPNVTAAATDAAGNTSELSTPFACTDGDADAVCDSGDNCSAWPNPSQSLPPWPVPANDPDCDGWTTADENAIGTAPDDACGTSAWPPDFNDDQSVDILDVNFLRVPVFFSEAPGPPYDVRLDLNPDGIIDIFDVNRMRAPIFFASCTP